MSYWNNAFRTALMGSVAAVVMVTQPAAAQTKTFNIPAQDAATAIPAFVKQSGLQVLATASDLQGIRTNAVSGSLSNDAALGQLIANTGLTLKTNDGTSAVIVRASAVEAVAEADPVVLSAHVLKFAATSAGRRVLREGRPPDIEKIKGWVDAAKHAVAA